MIDDRERRSHFDVEVHMKNGSRECPDRRGVRVNVASELGIEEPSTQIQNISLDRSGCRVNGVTISHAPCYCGRLRESFRNVESCVAAGFGGRCVQRRQSTRTAPILLWALSRPSAGPLPVAGRLV